MMPEITVDYRSSYYDPPRVKWWVIPICYCALDLLIEQCLPSKVGSLICILAFYLWPFYFCIWLRRIEPKSKGIFLYAASFLIEASATIAIFLPHVPKIVLGMTDFIGCITAILYIASLFVVRAELMQHYRKREDFSLSLGPWMTFFFAFIYFQYHLYDIGEQRRKERTQLAA